MTGETLMGKLHPSVPDGPFDVLALLRHEPPQDWRPLEAGEQVYGLVTSMETGKRDDYTFPVMYLMTYSGELYRIRCSAVMLKKPIAELRVKPGSVISITFDGIQQSRTGNREYRTYTVRSL